MQLFLHRFWPLRGMLQRIFGAPYAILNALWSPLCFPDLQIYLLGIRLFPTVCPPKKLVFEIQIGHIYKGDQLTFAKWFEAIILVRWIQCNMAWLLLCQSIVIACIMQSFFFYEASSMQYIVKVLNYRVSQKNPKTFGITYIAQIWILKLALLKKLKYLCKVLFCSGEFRKNTWLAKIRTIQISLVITMHKFIAFLKH